MATRDDVAKLAGVSSATVSRVLNNSAKVNSQKTEKVLEAIKALNYQPNMKAKSLRARKNFVIAYIVPDVVNPNYTEIYVGIVMESIKFSYQCHIIEHSQFNVDFLNSNYDGIVTSVEFENDVLEQITIPIIFEGIQKINGYENHLFINHQIQESLNEAFDLLWQKNHKSIGLIIHDKNNNPYLEFYKSYLESHHMKLDESKIIKYNDPKYQYNIGYESMKLLLETGKLNAVLAENDLIAIGAMKAIHEEGLLIPSEFSIIGIDDTVAAQFSNPTLTSIKKYKKVLGSYMFELLYSEMSNTPVEHKEFVSELVLRESF